MAYRKNAKGYNRCTVADDSGKTRSIRVCRAIASSIIGPPPTPRHTADHIDRIPENDNDNNIRWLCESKQKNNRKMPEALKTAYVVVKDGIEKTVQGWIEYLRGDKNNMNRSYTKGSIEGYARRKHNGFSYKEYPDLPGEVWKKIVGSESWKGHWEISDMNRVKYVTKYVVNVLSGERISLTADGYPSITLGPCHILSFATFFPEKYAAKKPGEMILHEDDDKMDFRPEKLRLGTGSENATDAHNNGKYYGTKTVRMHCVSYIDGILEKEHHGQRAAVKYLKSIGYEKASAGNISNALNNKYASTFAYDRTWKKI